MSRMWWTASDEPKVGEAFEDYCDRVGIECGTICPTGDLPGYALWASNGGWVLWSSSGDPFPIPRPAGKVGFRNNAPIPVEFFSESTIGRVVESAVKAMRGATGQKEVFVPVDAHDHEWRIGECTYDGSL